MEVSQQIMNIVIGDKKMANAAENEMEIRINTLCYGAGMFVEIVWPQLKSEIERIKKVIKEKYDSYWAPDEHLQDYVIHDKHIYEFLDVDLLEEKFKKSCKDFDDLHKSTKSINKQQKYYEWGVEEIRRDIGNHNSRVRNIPNLMTVTELELGEPLREFLERKTGRLYL